MPISNPLAQKLTALEQQITLYKEKSKQLKTPKARQRQQMAQLEALYAGLRKALATVVVEQEDDDWLTLVNSSDLPEESKQVVRDLLSVNTGEKEAKAYALMVTNFYKKYYSNQQKLMGKLDSGLEVSPEHYHGCLQKAIAYTIKTKGKAAQSTDFSMHLILLLKGHLKENDLKNGEVEYALGTPNVNGTQLTIKGYQLEKEWADLTDWLNKKPPLAKSMFYIASSKVVLQFSGSGTFDQGKKLEQSGDYLKDFVTVSGELLSRKMNATLKEATLDLAVANAKIALNLGHGISVELGTKIMNFASSVNPPEGDDFWDKVNSSSKISPVEIFGTVALNLEGLIQLFPEHTPLEQFVDLKLEVVLKVTTELGVDPLSPDLKDSVEDIAKFLEKQERTVNKEQIKLLKQQQAYIEVSERTTKSQQLYKERQSILQRAELEVNVDKKKKLQREAFDKAIALQKEKKIIAQRLKESSAVNLQDLNEAIAEKSTKIKKALQKGQVDFDKLTKKLANKTQVLIAQTMKRTAAKRALSLMAKFVPGLNLISFAVDVYDVSCLAYDLYTTYYLDDITIPTDDTLARIENATIDVTTLAPILTDFFYSIGAGGKLLELSPEEAKELQQFLEQEFPEGETSGDFMAFCMNYGEHYGVVETSINNNSKLIQSVKKYSTTYNPSIELREAEVVQEGEINFDNAPSSNFFDTLYYTIIEGDPTLVGSNVLVDITGSDSNDEGQNVQITISKKKLLELKVIQDLGDKEYKLKRLDIYILRIKGFKSYKMAAGAVFIYKQRKNTLTLR